MLPNTFLENISRLEFVLDYFFNNKSLLLNAVIHRSYSNENKDFKNLNNEKLELLGDSVLGVVVVEYLYNRFVNLSEGELVRIKSVVVSEHSISEFAKQISLGDYIILSKGEELNGGKNRVSILADAFEAVIGAIFLDSGLEGVKRFLIPFLIPKIDYLNQDEDSIDYKTVLQEYAQSSFKDTPKYQIVNESGPDHSKTFLVEVILNGKKIAESYGNSKKEAEQSAAKNACKSMNISIVRLF